MLEPPPMTRYGFVLGVAFALPLAACGGSSSETPPPLQPDPRGFHYAGVSAPEPLASDAGAEPIANGVDEDDEVKPRAPAQSTWGGSAPHH